MECTTGNGITVLVDNETQKKLAAHPDALDLLPEALSKLIIHEEGRFYKTDIDLGRVVGGSALVDTPKVELDTATFFAYRKERKFPTHISTLSKPKPCTTIAISLHKDERTKRWMLTTAYVGRSVPHEPFYYFDKESWYYGNEEEFKRSLDFWMKHALTIEPGITGEPYKSTWRKEIERIKLASV